MPNYFRIDHLCTQIAKIYGTNIVVTSKTYFNAKVMIYPNIRSYKLPFIVQCNSICTKIYDDFLDTDCEIKEANLSAAPVIFLLDSRGSSTILSDL